MAPPEFHTVIVGASVAGALTALRLARAGVPSTVLELRTAPRAKVCGEGLHPAGRTLLEDVLDDVEGLGIALSGFEFTTPRAPLLSLDHPAGRPGLGVDRLLLERHLWRALDSNPSIDFRTGVPVRHLGRTQHGWDLETRDGRFTASHVVAADGVRSRLREWAGRGNGRRYGRWGVRQRFRIVAPTPSHVEICFCGDGEIFVTPLAADRVSVAVLGKEQLARRLHDPRQLRRYLEPIATFADAEAEARPEILPHRGEDAPRCCDERLYLAGDAAVFLDPISGAGMTLATLSAKVIADGLVAIHRGEVGDATAEARAERELRAIVRPFRRLTRLLLVLARSNLLRWGTAKLLSRAPRLLDRLARPTLG